MTLILIASETDSKLTAYSETLCQCLLKYVITKVLQHFAMISCFSNDGKENGTILKGNILHKLY